MDSIPLRLFYNLKFDSRTVWVFLDYKGGTVRNLHIYVLVSHLINQIAIDLGV